MLNYQPPSNNLNSAAALSKINAGYFNYFTKKISCLEYNKKWKRNVPL